MSRGVGVFVLCGLLGFIGCKKSSSSKKFSVTESGQFSQVLKDFQMQDIYNGSKNMTVESVEGRLREAEQIIDVDAPKVTFFKEGDVSSTLVAPQGQVIMETHEVKVWGGVAVVTPDSATLNTESLRYNPERQRFLSDDPVRLERKDSVTIGVGLEATPDLSRVRIGHQKVYVRSKPE